MAFRLACKLCGAVYFSGEKHSCAKLSVKNLNLPPVPVTKPQAPAKTAHTVAVPVTAATESDKTAPKRKAVKLAPPNTPNTPNRKTQDKRYREAHKVDRSVYMRSYMRKRRAAEANANG